MSFVDLPRSERFWRKLCFWSALNWKNVLFLWRLRTYYERWAEFFFWVAILGKLLFTTNRLRITNLQNKRLATCKIKYAALALRPTKIKFIEGEKVWNKSCWKWFKLLFHLFYFDMKMKKVGPKKACFYFICKISQNQGFWPCLGHNCFIFQFSSNF